MRLVGLIALAATIATAASTTQHARPAVRMSVHNRLLFDRAAVSGLSRIEVLMLTDPATIDRLADLVVRSGGTVGRAHVRIGYLRADLPIENMIAVVGDPLVAAWHISTAS